MRTNIADHTCGPGLWSAGVLEDYYRILEIGRDAALVGIKKAYYALSSSEGKRGKGKIPANPTRI